MKVVINTCYGGFGLSEIAITKMEADLDMPYGTSYITVNADVDPNTSKIVQVFVNDSSKMSFRTDPYLIKVVEELGKAASADGANLVVIEVDDDAVGPYIEEYDGVEWVAEGRRWYCHEYEEEE